MSDSLAIDAEARQATKAVQPATSCVRENGNGKHRALGKVRRQSAAYMVSKRVLDVVLSAAGLLVAAPIMALIVLAVKLDSRGPALFKQRRVGFRGRLFRMYKFRTMVDNAESLKSTLQHLNQYDDGKFFKIKDDPRTTRIGYFLRRTSLDELPQLVNVLRGEMSLVGPRPPVPEEVVHYAHHHFQRLTVPPGITGLWQVRGRSDVTDFEDVVRLDVKYIENRSLGLDFVILTQTLPAILRRNGAA